MQVQIAAKRGKDEWRGALIVDGKFEDALVESSLKEMIVTAIVPVLMVAHENSMEVALTLNITPLPMVATEKS